jgi:RNA polymerase sigma-70 factor (ECF subfamily)
LKEISQLIEQMPPRRQEIFRNSKLEGKSSKEVAAELNISAGTVDNQVSEALKFIRSRINKENLAILLFAILFVY